MIGGDNGDVFNDSSIISLSKGSLGLSLRGKSPIFDENNTVIGIVSVGYMVDEITVLHKALINPFISICFLLFISLFIFSWLFAKAIKKQMFNLEPKEIALLVKSQQSIMQSIYEGIIAVDIKYNITNINQSAKEILTIADDVHNLIGKPLHQYINHFDFIHNDNNKLEDIHDQICYFNDIIVIASRVRILIDNKIQGWVISFRCFEDINLLSSQLTQVKQYADNLRTLHHEHLNWMTTLSELIYMKRYDEAEKFIQLHANDNQKSLDFIAERFKEPMICGLLIGKYSQANEKDIKLTFDPANQLDKLPPNITEAEFMSILGNLLDNAFKACLKNPLGSKSVSLFLSDATEEIVLEVSDQGCGVDESIRDTLFEPGVTTEDPKEHGIDLHLVATYTKKANGYIAFIKKYTRINPLGIASSLKEAKIMVDKLKPTLILLDNYLPNGQGITLFEHIINNNLPCYVIFITAASDMETCSKAIRYGCFDYLIKD